MTRRSAMNKRYQKGSEPTGSTRRSAASAKPKREAGELTKPKTPAKKPSLRERMNARAKGTPLASTAAKASRPAKSSSSKSNERIPFVMTPEIKKLRRIWWIMLLIGAVLLVAVLIYNYGKLIPITQTNSIIAVVFEAIALVLVILCWILDLKKIRPLMKQATLEHETKKKK